MNQHPFAKGDSVRFWVGKEYKDGRKVCSQKSGLVMASWQVWFDGRFLERSYQIASAGCVYIVKEGKLIQ